MAVDAARTLNNSLDVGRKIPASAIAPSALAGLTVEKIVGPGSGATVLLSQPAEAIAHIFAITTTTGAWPGVNPPNPVESVDYTAVLEGAVSGVAEITEAAATARTSETWMVLYVPKAVDPDQGGQNAVSP